MRGRADALLAAIEVEQSITRSAVQEAFDHAGIMSTDPRISPVMSYLRHLRPDDEVDRAALWDTFENSNLALISRVLEGRLAIPDFADFKRRLAAIFEQAGENGAGEVADYIPQLARVDPDAYAMSVCTVDGQRFSFGRATDPYCVQSTCKPINYAIVLDRLGAEEVHRHVGREPSGASFNELALNSSGLPHNPMINAGAIMCASLVEPSLTAADRFDAVLQTWKALAPGGNVGFDNAVFLSERDTADRNFALAYFMKEKRAFQEGADIHAALDLYFQCCSITVDASTMALIASALANGGVSPLSNERVFSSETVKNCLSLMASCGMYDFSGEYAFSVGLPAKSGVSGALFIVVPGLCGISIWSPKLDPIGNTVRGLEISKRLTETFVFHTYSDLLTEDAGINPRRSVADRQADDPVKICTAASQGDLVELRRLVARGVDVNVADYDGRTALHLAASEGRREAVSFLLSRKANPDAVDRWRSTPLADAEREGHADIAAMLANAQPGGRSTEVG
jgi:glutaminase